MWERLLKQHRPGRLPTPAGLARSRGEPPAPSPKPPPQTPLLSPGFSKAQARGPNRAPRMRDPTWASPLTEPPEGIAATLWLRLSKDRTGKVNYTCASRGDDVKSRPSSVALTLLAICPDTLQRAELLRCGALYASKEKRKC